MDKAEVIDNVWPRPVGNILATTPFMPESCLAFYVSVPPQPLPAPLLEKFMSQVLVLEKSWLHLLLIEYSPPSSHDRGEAASRHSIGTDAVKSIETEWYAYDSFVDIDNALEASRSCKVSILLDREFGGRGKRIVLPLGDDDYGDLTR